MSKLVRWSALVIVALLFGVVFWRTRAPGDGAAAPQPAERRTTGEAEAAGPELSVASSRASVEHATSAPDAADAAPQALELHGVLLDRATNEPLFAYELRLGRMRGHGGDFAPALQTDADGRFAWRALDPSCEGNTRLKLVDHAASESRRNAAESVAIESLSGAAQPMRIAIDVGPTAAFDVAFPAGYATGDFEAFISWSRPSGSRANSESTRTPLREPLTFGPHPGRPWLRLIEPRSEQDALWVELRSKDRRWRGGAWLKQLVGVVREPLSVRLEPSTRLRGRFVWPTECEERWIQLELAPLAHESTRRRPASGGAGENGEFEFVFLEPGPHRLWSTSPHFAPLELEVDVRPGDNDLGVIALAPRRVAGAIRGLVRSRSGRFEGACHVSLSRRAFEHGAYFDHSLDFEPLDPSDPSSELVASIEFDDVTEGEWYVYVHCHDGFEFPAALATVQAPNEELEIVLDDPTLDVRVSIVEAESGRPCAEASVSWDCGDAHDRENGAEFTLQRLPLAPERFEWIASAPGRASVRGTGLDFERSQRPDGKVELVGRIALPLGFGRFVRAYSRSDGAPLEGVEVFGDGELLGRTGVNGVLALRRDAPPQRLEFRKPGWFVCRSRDFDPRTGRYSDDGELFAAFEPEQP
ncbi:MAG: hypothetical protein JNN27_08370 [Planctomycetes bacterium]|nr:hypothetical protein [Planctomycetota bacterium]